MKDKLVMQVGSYYLLTSGVPVHCVQRWGNSYTLHSVWGPQSFLVDADGHSSEAATGVARQIGKIPTAALEAGLFDYVGQAVIEGRKAYDALVSFLRREPQEDYA